MIPRLGFGTYKLSGRAAVEAVRHALELGYRHIDTAQAYDNEHEVGEGLRRSGVDPDEVFLASKVWHTELRYEQVLAAIERSRRRLGRDTIDLMYVHWPSSEGVSIQATLSAFDTARARGWIRFIGVSNFPPSLLDRSADLVELAALQVEHHPFLDQSELLDMCREHDITLVSYCPLARGRVTRDPTLRAIARAHDATPAQVALAWLLSKEHCAAIPKAASAAHRRENLAALELELEAEEIARIDGLARDLRLIDPAHAPNWEAGALA